MKITKWEGDEQRLGSGGLSEAEGFVFEMSKLNICRLIEAKTMITLRKMLTVTALRCHMDMVNRIIKERTSVSKIFCFRLS